MAMCYNFLSHSLSLLLVHSLYRIYICSSVVAGFVVLSMRRIVWLAALVLVLWLGCTGSSELDPGQQAKVSTALDSAQFVLNEVNEHYKSEMKAIKDALKVSEEMESVELLQKQLKLAKIASVVSKALKAVQAAAAIASFIFTFFMPSQLDVITDLINERFKEVNAKLDRLDEKLDEVEQAIKANTAFNTFLSVWITWEYTSKNGAKKLSEIRVAMGTKTRRIDKVRLAEEYVNYYENNNLDGNLLDLYRMAALPETVTQRNIFDRFIAEYGCDIPKLAELMILVKNIMSSAAQQKMTYYFLKGDEVRATEGFKDVQKYFFEIRRAFDDRVWNCRRKSVDDAKKDADEILKEMKDSSQESIVQAIFDELKFKYPYYTWTVAAAQNEHPYLRGLDWRGTTYLKVQDSSDSDKVKDFLIVYEDTKSSSNCIEITEARTVLVFKRCEGCNSDYISAADNVLTKERCGTSTLEKLVDIPHEVGRSSEQVKKAEDSRKFVSCSKCADRNNDDCTQYAYDKCVQLVKQEIQRWDFIASAVNSIPDVCTSGTCNGHGLCKQIPSTKTHQCICEKQYGGESCENRVEFDDTIEKKISELRETFNVVNGVPTAVDVFFAVRSLSQRLDVVLQKIRASFAYTNQIIQHSGIIYNVEDIADLYGKLQKNELTFTRFGDKVDKYLKTVTSFELENRLRKMILGLGALDTPGNDIYNTYKSEYLSQNGGGCSATYNQDIKGFRDDLTYLDQALGEVLLQHQNWLLQTKGTTEALRNKYKSDAEYIQDVFKGRQGSYNQYWKSWSCGVLNIEGTNVACQEELTYEGMVVSPTCDRQRQLTPSKVTCQRNDNELQWDSQPKCKFVWGEFGAWGPCSKTCDGGIMYRYRPCLGTEDVENCKRDQGGLEYETAPCETQPCCSAQYGKFKCSNGRCIRLEYVCDGDNDCWNNDDESRSRCPDLIRSGDMIALESNSKRGKWLNCYCTMNCGKDRCTLGTCPGSEMSGSDWNNCGSERFRLYLTNGNHGEAVRSGDRIAIQYGWNYETKRGNWLSCWVSGSVCPTRPCPGLEWDSEDNENCRGEYFWIYSPERMGSCSSDTRIWCRGKPLQKGDNVFIQYSINDNTPWWLSEDDDDIRTRTCPGLFIDSSDRRCVCESWNIFSRGY